MRDPARISTLLAQLAEIWGNDPDLRLCQIIGNALPGYIAEGRDIYFVEDDELIERLQQTVEFYRNARS